MEIRLENISKVFSKKKKGKVPAIKTVAVDNFSYSFKDGQLIGLLGPSGCGKSTTLYMIAGLHDPTDGKIYFGDKNVTKLRANKRGIGLVFQNYALYPHMTVLQNILFPLQNIKMKKDLALKQAQKMAVLVGIEDQLHKKPAELSGGQQQRVAIARALAKNPSVLLLDEPLSNLDARLRLQTREELKRIQRETGITMIFVTHDQEEAMSISDEIVLLNKGKVQQVGIPQEVYNDPENLFIAKFLGTPPIGIFNGVMHQGVLKIGEQEIAHYRRKEFLEAQNLEVSVGIRPEGYIPSSKGTFTVAYNTLETIGRDFQLVCTNDHCETASFRIILDDSHAISPKEMKFNIRKEKCFIFDKVTGERLGRVSKEEHELLAQESKEMSRRLYSEEKEVQNDEKVTKGLKTQTIKKETHKTEIKSQPGKENGIDWSVDSLYSKKKK